MQISINCLKSKPAWPISTERITLKVNSFILLFFSHPGGLKPKKLPTNSNNKLPLEMLAFPCSKKRQLICSKFSGGGSVKVLQKGFDQKSPNKFSISDEI